MFNKWICDNCISDFSLSARLFPSASDRDFWEKVISKDYINVAEKYLDYEWPMIRASQFMAFEKCDNRAAQEQPHFERRRVLLTFFLAELKERKGRFLPDLCDGIFLICEETFWGLSAHMVFVEGSHLLPHTTEQYIDLFAAETAELLAVIYHILYEDIKEYCAELLTRIEYELERRIITPYLNHTEFFWMGNVNLDMVNNWNPWVISNLLTVFLTVTPQKNVFEKGITKMLHEINHYYKKMPDDGGCDEGSNYWGQAGAKLFSFCDQLYIASGGKINFFSDEKLRRIGHYEVDAYIGGCYFVNFADGNALIKNKNLDYPLYGFGLRTGDRSFCKFAKTLKNNQCRDGVEPKKGESIKEVLFSLIYADEISAEPEFELQECCVFSVLQTSFMRAKDWYYAAKGGHNSEHHNHNDVGSFLVYHNALPLIIDAGCGTYTRLTFDSRRYTIWTMQSGWHNLPVVNGVEQKDGGVYRANSFGVDGKNTAVSFAKAYPEKAEVQSIDRQISIDEGGVTVVDDFVFCKENNTVQENFLTLLKPEITKQGVVIGGKYLLESELNCEVEWKDFEGDKKLINAWGTEGLYRIKLNTKCGKNVSLKIKIRSL